MSEVTVDIPDQEPEAPKRDDAAFAHGEAAGRYEAHMSASDQRMHALEADNAALKQQLADLNARVGNAESASLSASIAATEAAIVANEAEREAEVAAEEAEEAEGAETGVEVTELTMPEVPTEGIGEHHEPKKSGISWLQNLH